MNPAATLRDVAESLRSRPWRISLAGCSIAAGMAALTVLVAVTGGLVARTRAMVAELGVNVFGVTQPSEAPAAPERASVRLGARHVEALRAALPGALVAGVRLYRAHDAGLPDGTVVMAADEALCRVRPWRLVAGRLPDAADTQAQTRYALVSVTLARELGLRPGLDLRLRAQPYPVLGLIDVGGAAAGDAYRPGERVVVVPAGIPPYWLDGDAVCRPGLEAVFVRTRDATGLAAALARARNLFSQPDLGIEPAVWLTPETLAREWSRYQRVVTVAGGSMVVLCLLMGGITLMSLLLADVRERIPEIGLRRSLGASRAQVGWLFLAEAVTLTAVASGVGIAGAALALAAVGGSLPLPWAWTPACVAIPLAAGLGLGVLFSYLPARRAAGIEPAEALRND